MNTVSYPSNDLDYRGIYEYLCWKASHAGESSAVLHFIEVLYLAAESGQGIQASVVDNLGGEDYEGNKTSHLNYLQRIRILKEAETALNELQHLAIENNLDMTECGTIVEVYKKAIKSGTSCAKELGLNATEKA